MNHFNLDLSFSYHFTKDRSFRFNYRCFYPYRYRKRRRFVLILAPILLLLALYFGFDLYQGYITHKDNPAALSDYFNGHLYQLLFMVLLLFIASTRLYQFTIGLRKRIKAELNSTDHQTLFRESQIHFTEQGIHEASERYSFMIRWNEIIEIVEFNEFLAIFITQSNGLILEKSALTETQLTTIKEAINHYTELPIIQVNH